MDWLPIVYIAVSIAGGAWIGYKIGVAVGYDRGLGAMLHAGLGSRR